MVLSSKLVQAALDGDTAAIWEWFETGTRDPDERHSNGQTLLYLAAAKGHCDMMRELLDRGASPRGTAANGWTPLHVAALLQRHDAAVLLLERGAQIDKTTPQAQTSLITAAKHGHCDMIRLLLHRGANLDARDSSRNYDAEGHARYENKAEAAALLAEIRLAGGWQPYVRAPRKQLLMLRILCERGRASPSRVGGEDIRDLQARILGASSLAEAQNVARMLEPAPPRILSRLFPWRPPLQGDVAATEERATLRARAPWVAPLPKEVFWLILEFWRCDRDTRY